MAKFVPKARPFPTPHNIPPYILWSNISSIGIIFPISWVTPIIIENNTIFIKLVIKKSFSKKINPSKNMGTLIIKVRKPTFIFVI